ncbi:hypothetical protein [Streptomyces sp. XH2]|uniref:hypothetical protein n=1 Tax=Streptomyces sp. XH2 TaxID=3412483 RepID=UPI003C7D47B3
MAAKTQINISPPLEEEYGLDDVILENPEAFFDQVGAEVLREQGPVARFARRLLTCSMSGESS